MVEKPRVPDSVKTTDEYFDWRNQQRQRHRVMTLGEYNLWCKVGDAFDDHCSTDTFRGGLTIVLDGRPPIFGGYED